MKNLRRAFGILSGALLLASILPAISLAGDPGSAGLLHMRLGMGARQGAMGDTGVALARDGSAIYWNPANLAHVEGTQLMLQHMEYFESFRMESFTLAHQSKMGSVGLIFSGFYSDELVRRSLEPAAARQGKFQPYDLVMGLGYARRFSGFSLGLNWKFLYERIDVYDGWGQAFDLGFYHQAKIEGLTMAAVVQNYGSNFKLHEEEFELPFVLRMGFAYQPILKQAPWARRFVVASDLVVPNDSNSRLHAGLEFKLHESFCVRAGHRFSYETWGSTFGMGFVRNSLRIDYSFMDNSNDFDGTHRFSIGLAYTD